MSFAAPPLLFEYVGEGEWRPANRFVAGRADSHYVIGQTYPLVEHNERSAASHAHFFSMVKEYWMTLPESLAAEYPSPEHLRKKALIRCGFADEQAVVLDTHRDAITLAGHAAKDEYAVVVVEKRVVKIFTARSQNRRSMNGEEFQKSKTACLDYIDNLLGTARAKEKESANGDAT